MKLIKTEVHTFYFVLAMLKISKKYMVEHLLASKEVGPKLRKALELLVFRINDIEATARYSADAADKKDWHYEWGKRDHEIFGQIYANVCEMNEEQRLIVEEFTNQLLSGNVKVA